MRVLAVFIAIAVVAASLPSHLRPPAFGRNYQYTQQTLTLSWPGNFCANRQCNRNWMSSWNGWVLKRCRRSFIIHGLWPNSPDPGFIRMISTSKVDPSCTSNYAFDLGWHDQSTIQRLNQVWPDLIQNNFWAYEWGKHGTCYLKLLSDRVNRGLKPTVNFARSVQQKYFNNALSLYQRFTSNFRLTKGTYSNGDELIRALGLQPNQVMLSVVRVYGNIRDKVSWLRSWSAWRYQETLTILSSLQDATSRRVTPDLLSFQDGDGDELINDYHGFKIPYIWSPPTRATECRISFNELSVIIWRTFVSNSWIPLSIKPWSSLLSQPSQSVNSWRQESDQSQPITHATVPSYRNASKIRLCFPAL